jgi:CheY-like chemotaxis protein
LIAEDEVMVLNVARIALERAGYFLLTASDGQQALLLSRQFPAKIDLVISDIKMSKMNGIELHPDRNRAAEYQSASDFVSAS